MIVVVNFYLLKNMSNYINGLKRKNFTNPCLVAQAKKTLLICILNSPLFSE